MGDSGTHNKDHPLLTVALGGPSGSWGPLAEVSAWRDTLSLPPSTDDDTHAGDSNPKEQRQPSRDSVRRVPMSVCTLFRISAEMVTTELKVGKAQGPTEDSVMPAQESTRPLGGVLP